ncbi:MAG TPA: hypothetical protein VGG50_21000 [Streptosporangiaceae bacterium]
MNVKKAVATVAGTIGVLLLAAVVGLGHLASHPGSTPARATLTAHIYGDSVNVPASTSSTSTTSTGSSSGQPSYVDNSSSYTSVYGDDGSTSPASTDGSGIYGDGTSTIYGDGTSSSSGIYGDGTSTIYGDGSNSSSGIYGDGTTGVTAQIYGD